MEKFVNDFINEMNRVDTFFQKNLQKMITDFVDMQKKILEKQQ